MVCYPHGQPVHCTKQQTCLQVTLQHAQTTLAVSVENVQHGRVALTAVCLPAGHETTATTTAAALYCISAHPAVEAQLQAELQAVLGDRPPTYADLEQLPYLQVSCTILHLGISVDLCKQSLSLL